MKKILVIIIANCLFNTGFGQGLPASTVPSNKKALIEMFTGIHDPYGPNGYISAYKLFSGDPTTTRLLTIHSGSLALPSPWEQDFTTTDGTAIAGMPGMGITKYPAGAINRTVLDGTVMATPDYYAWPAMASTIKTQTAYCNVAVQGTLNATTRVLTVIAEAFFTANSPTTNSMTIMLLENNVPGVQLNYSNPIDGALYNQDETYKHNHLLRKVLTPTFGTNIPVTSMGTSFTTSVSYTVPETYGASGTSTECLLGNLELMAFVNDFDGKNIQNVATNSITVENYPNAIDAAIKKLDTDASSCFASLTKPLVKITNYGSTMLTEAVITYSVAGSNVMTYTASTNIKPYTYDFLNLPTYTFTPTITDIFSVSLVSANGSIDPVTSNNTYSSSISKTTIISNSTYMQMEFTQDAYGNDVEWRCIDESTGKIVGSDGPFEYFRFGPETKLWTKTFDVVPNKCYKLTVTDAGGDGINNGMGVGNYILKANGTNLIFFNGAFTIKNDQWFMTSATANSLGELSQTISNINIFPNPAKNSSTISVDLVQNETITIQVLSIMGQVVFTQTLSNLTANNHSILLNTENWTEGIYNVNIATASETFNRKLIILKD